MMEDRHNGDVCRVCRCEAIQDKPLFYPCLCTGSIKYIHQDCLVQWLKYSKKEYCELCKHKFIFTPIYAPDMPKRLPIRDIISGLIRSVSRAIRYWLHYTLVTIAWLGIVPVAAGRTYRCLFSGSLLNLSMDVFSTENLLSDSLLGCVVMACTLCTFVGLVWLREQILHGNAAVDWLDNLIWANNNNVPNENNNVVAQQPQAQQQQQQQQQQQPAANEGEAVVPADNGEQAAEQEQDQNNIGQEDNWNPMDWDRGAEELTWERLLGLDGSLLFLEHVFWVISLNTLFILVFAFFPYHVGNFVFVSLSMRDTVIATRFEGFISTLLGYLMTAIFFFLFYVVVSLLKLPKAAKLFGMFYTCIKVSLLVVMEIGIFPLICGWWLDICSLSMFDAGVKDRIAGFKANPATSMFFHWLVGMVYIFYFASFILLLREVLRPGVLWFLRNLNDPDFNPVQEMIHLPVYRHVRRFLASLVVFGTIVLIMLRLPALFIHTVLPNFLPFHVMLSSPDLPISELSLELLLLQVILPAVLEQGHTRQWVKSLVRWWCLVVSYILGIRSYLLGDVPIEVEIGMTEEKKMISNDGSIKTDSQVTSDAAFTTPRIEVAESAENETTESAENGNISLSSLLIENRIINESSQLTFNEPIEGLINEDISNLIGSEKPTDVEVNSNTSAEPTNQDGDRNETSNVENIQPTVGSTSSNTEEVEQNVEENIGNVVQIAENSEQNVENNVANIQPATENAPQHVANVQPIVANHNFGNSFGSLGFQPYYQPNYFVFRLLCLIAMMCFTLFLTSLLSIIVPVSIGRQLMSLTTGSSKVHELYTAASGLYVCWLCLRLAVVFCTWIPKGSRVIRDKCREYFLLVSKTLVAASLIVGLIPLLLGLLFELFVVIPVRVPLNQTPIFFLGQDWALGVLHAKIITACTLIGPQWRLRRVIEQVYNQGLRNMDLKMVLSELCFPVVITLGLILSVPYVFARSIVPAMGFTFEIQHVVERQIYPFLLGIFLFIFFCVSQARQFKRLYEHIKNDKYLVGQRLVNYEKKP